MTKYDKIIGIANDMAGEDVSERFPRNIAGAIAAVTEQMAGEAIDNDGTIENAIENLAPFVSGGGGGGGGEAMLRVDAGMSGVAHPERVKVTDIGTGIILEPITSGTTYHEYSVPAGTVLKLEPRYPQTDMFDTTREQAYLMNLDTFQPDPFLPIVINPSEGLFVMPHAVENHLVGIDLSLTQSK